MGLRIVVCVKAVIRNTADWKSGRNTENTGINLFDRPVVNLARQLADQDAGTVTAITMGPESAGFALYEAMVEGADRGILISDPALKGSDTLVTSFVLANAVKKIGPFDLLLFGTRSSDSDTGHVGPQTAERLGIPLVINAHGLDVLENRFRVRRCADGYEEVFEMTAPASCTVLSEAIDVRHPALASIETVFETRGIERFSLSDLCIDPGDVGAAASPTRVIAFNRPEKRAACRYVQGSYEEQAERLAKELNTLGLMNA